MSLPVWPEANYSSLPTWQRCCEGQQSKIFMQVWKLPSNATESGLLFLHHPQLERWLWPVICGFCCANGEGTGVHSYSPQQLQCKNETTGRIERETLCTSTLCLDLEVYDRRPLCALFWRDLVNSGLPLIHWRSSENCCKFPRVAGGDRTASPGQQVSSRGFRACKLGKTNCHVRRNMTSVRQLFILKENLPCCRCLMFFGYKWNKHTYSIAINIFEWQIKHFFWVRMWTSGYLHIHK